MGSIAEQDYRQYVMDGIEEGLDRLADYYSPETMYVDEIARNIYENELHDGTLIMFNADARDFIFKNWEYASEFWETEEADGINPFSYPGRYALGMVIHSTENELEKCDFLQTLVGRRMCSSIEVNAATAALIKDGLGIEQPFGPAALSAMEAMFRLAPFEFDECAASRAAGALAAIVAELPGHEIPDEGLVVSIDGLGHIPVTAQGKVLEPEKARTAAATLARGLGGSVPIAAQAAHEGIDLDAESKGACETARETADGRAAWKQSKGRDGR